MTYEFTKMHTLTWNYRIQDEIKIELYYLFDGDYCKTRPDTSTQSKSHVTWCPGEVSIDR